MTTNDTTHYVITWRNAYTGRIAVLCDAHRALIGDAHVQYGAHRGRCAEDAAFAALQSYRQAERELALPLRSRSILTIHADVLRAQRVAESLVKRTR